MTLRRWVLAGMAGLIAALQGRSAALAGGPVNLVFDGDSISAGWGAAAGHGLDARVAAAVGPDVRLHNVAEGGRPVAECLRLYNQLVMPLFDVSASRNVIVFHAGDNDILQGRHAALIYAAFTAYVASAHRQGWKVVVSTELRRLDFYPPRSTELADYNASLRENRAGADGVVDFDADSRMTDMSLRHDPSLFTHDGLHPSDGGYSVLAGMLAPVVRRVAGR